MNLKWGLLIVFLLVHLNELAWATQPTTTKEKSVILNLAGKQRMLIEKISRDVTHIQHEMASLKMHLNEIEQILNGLKNGDPNLNLVKMENPDVLKQLSEISALWQPFRQNVEMIINSLPLDKTHQVAEQTTPLMNSINAVMNLYEKAFIDSFEPGMTTTLNLAGKQRMLSQQMAKEVQLILKNVNAEQNRTRLKETRASFDKILKGLIEGDSELGLPGTQIESPIYQKLMVVKQVWQSYQPLLDKIMHANDFSDIDQDINLAESRRISLDLLAHMHQVVNMYEQASGLQLSTLRKYMKRD